MAPPAVLQLKITLRDVRPPIWRRVELSENVTLLALHEVLQVAMGWTNSHLHQFRHGGEDYGPPDDEFGREVRSERKTRVADLLRTPGDRLVYEYDFGDGWEHDVVLEAIVEPQVQARYPRITAGKRSCPPEDVGGPHGYTAFLEALADSQHVQHRAMTEWVGGSFAPELFDVVTANDALPRRRTSARRGA